MTNTHQTWQAKNIARITKRISSVRAMDNGTLLAEPSGNHFVVVTKEENELRLWLHDEANANTGVIQSELNLAEPLQLVDPYIQSAFLGLLWQSNPQSILTTGLGGGCFPTVAHHYLPDTVIQCVESDAVVAAAAQQYFGFQPDSTLQLAIDDGRAWLAHHGEQNQYDLIFHDVFQDDGFVPHTSTSVEWFELCGASLADHGVLIVNLLYLDPHRTARIKTIHEVFDHLYLLAMQDDNDVLFASQQPLPRDSSRIDRAAQIQSVHHFPFPFASRAAKLMPFSPDEEKAWVLASILTDEGQ